MCGNENYALLQVMFANIMIRYLVDAAIINKVKVKLTIETLILTDTRVLYEKQYNMDNQGTNSDP